MKIFALVTPVFFLLFSNPTFSQISNETLMGVVKIEAKNSGLTTTGTGVYLSQGRGRNVIIATAAHVVGDDTSPSISFRDKKLRNLSGKVIYRENPDKDDAIAFISVEFGDLMPSSSIGFQASDRLSMGNSIEAVGMHRFAGDWSQSVGTISGIRGSMLAIDAKIDSGNSGGPVFFNGRVVGIVASVRNTLTDGVIAYVIRSEKIYKTYKNVIGIKDPITVPGSRFTQGFDSMNWITNHKSRYSSKILGTWCYYFNGSRNLDGRIIYLDDNDQLRIKITFMQFSEESFQVANEWLQNDRLTFEATFSDFHTKVSLKILNDNLMQGTSTDKRGTHTINWQKLRSNQKSCKDIPKNI